jgi:putative transcriptional regulator
MHKRWIYLSLLIILVLPAGFIVGSPSGAATSARGMGGLRLKGFVTLQDPGEPGSENELAKGKFLVASRRLNDPNFHETVVLLIRYGPDGAVGLVINRPLKAKLSTVFPKFKELEQRTETLYLGGPVEPNKMLLLVRSAKPAEASVQVFSNIYISSSWKELQRLIKKPEKDERFRIYAGYAGWAPKQLEFERNRGDWHVLKGDAETLFDKKSSEVWKDLIQRFSVNWVRAKNSS